jgi:hypothetical protein
VDRLRPPSGRPYRPRVPCCRRCFRSPRAVVIPMSELPTMLEVLVLDEEGGIHAQGLACGLRHVAQASQRH